MAIIASSVAAIALLALWNPADLLLPDDHTSLLLAIAAVSVAVFGGALTVLTAGRRRLWRLPGFTLNAASAVMLLVSPLFIFAVELFDEIDRREVHTSTGEVVRITRQSYGMGPDSSCITVDLIDGEGLFAHHRKSRCVHHESEIRVRLIDDTHLEVMLDWTVPCTLIIDWQSLSLTATSGADERCQRLSEPL